MMTEKELNILWAAATSSAIETRQKPHIIEAQPQPLQLPAPEPVILPPLTPPPTVTETPQ